jgi:hypothetical protein
VRYWYIQYSAYSSRLLGIRYLDHNNCCTIIIFVSCFRSSLLRGRIKLSARSSTDKKSAQRQHTPCCVNKHQETTQRTRKNSHKTKFPAHNKFPSISRFKQLFYTKSQTSFADGILLQQNAQISIR